VVLLPDPPVIGNQVSFTIKGSAGALGDNALEWGQASRLKAMLLSGGGSTLRARSRGRESRPVHAGPAHEGGDHLYHGALCESFGCHSHDVLLTLRHLHLDPRLKTAMWRRAPSA
jgi:hypothetical protein